MQVREGFCPHQYRLSVRAYEALQDLSNRQDPPYWQNSSSLLINPSYLELDTNNIDIHSFQSIYDMMGLYLILVGVGMIFL